MDQIEARYSLMLDRPSPLPSVSSRFPDVREGARRTGVRPPRATRSVAASPGHLTHRANSFGARAVFSGQRKCVHHYVYLIDPEFGFMHVRIQAWIPYQVQIYINGREWLARQLDAAGVGYRRYDNALLHVDDLEIAARLCDKFAHRSWPAVLNAFARRVNPLLAMIGQAGFGGYYRAGGSNIASLVTGSRPTTKPRCCESRPQSTIRASSVSSVS